MIGKGGDYFLAINVYMIQNNEYSGEEHWKQIVSISSFYPILKKIE